MKKITAPLLALLALALGVMCFRLWGNLRTAEALAKNAEAQRLALLARVDELEKRERKLRDEANVRAQSAAGERTRGATANGGPRSDSAGPGRPQITESPEMRRLMAIEQKGRLDGRYAALFKALNLPPEQLEKLKQLLVDKQSAPMDVFAEARAQGLVGPDSRAQIQELLKSTNSEIDDNIRGTLGESAFQQYQQYEQTAPQRSVVDQLTNRLSYTDAPLSSTQATQLVTALAAIASSSAGTNGTDGVRFTATMGGPGGPPLQFGGGGNVITEAAIVSVQGLLNSSQLTALRQLQAEQQAQQQMGQAMRDSFRNNNGGATTVATPGAATTTTVISRGGP